MSKNAGEREHESLASLRPLTWEAIKRDPNLDIAAAEDFDVTMAAVLQALKEGNMKKVIQLIDEYDQRWSIGTATKS